MVKELLKNAETEEEQILLLEQKFEELKSQNDYCKIVDLVDTFSSGEVDIAQVVQGVVNGAKFWDIVAMEA